MTDISTYTLLSKVNSPADIKKLSEAQLVSLCGELRQFIIDSLSENPGHFGASLGVVELTTAIHYVFNTPTDSLIWDVGHQSYPHKILTGRRDDFHTKRHYGGISGFPKMSESPYDAFGTGHSSTSISAALGMAEAARLRGDYTSQHIAVIGDGSLTAGQAFEALNQGGVSSANLLVIVNDNGIAIDENVGALYQYFTRITASHTYNRLKDRIWTFLGDNKTVGHAIRKFIQKVESAIKVTFIRRNNLFESLNFRYFGPIDGHNVVRMTKILYDLKDIPGPKVLHCVTVKGKGFLQAEKEKTKYHAPGLFNKETGELITATSSTQQPPKYQTVFGQTLLELAKDNPNIVGVTPAMASGCSLDIMMKEMPHRAFDVGITEQHAVTFSAGLATKGFIPFCNVYSTFMQRGYDQIIHDVALQKLPVIFCLDRSGLVGEDGSTHHGAFDLAYMRCVPNLIVSAPMNEGELRNLMYTAQLANYGPFSIRYPRGNGVMVNWKTPLTKVEIGTGRMLREGERILLISLGHVGNYAQKATDIMAERGVKIGHVDIRFLKPLDEKLLHQILSSYQHIITIEDGTIVGGMGSAIQEFISEHGYNLSIKKLGIPDTFIEHGTVAELQKECGYTVDDIVREIESLL